MRKLYTLVFGLAISIAVNAQVWNFSDSDLNVLGNPFTTTVTVRGLTMYSNADASLAVDANNKSLDGFSFTNRMKTGGAAVWENVTTPTTRILSFNVTGNTKITIYCMSSSSSADRVLNVATASNGELIIIGTATALGTALSKTEINYTGAANTIYLYSPASGVNIYYIAAEATTPTAIKNVQLGKVISTEFFNITGAKAAINYEDLNAGVYIQKTTYENGQTTTTKIIKQKR